MKEILLVVLGVCFVGCSGSGGGSGGATVAPNTWTSYGVATVGDLPTCAGDILGRLYFVESTNQFELCKSSGWAIININGTNGSTIYSNKRCSKISGSVTFEHKILTFSTGDKLVTCAISNALDTFSNTSYYLSSQTGASTEGCIVTFDLDTASSGFWYFSTNGTTRTSVYNDSGSASNNTTITFATSDCSTVP